jgi:hypothetical protein
MLSLHYPQNAFSERFFKFLFNFFTLFVVDLLHEFELGVWKAIFTHLMRILFAAGGSAIQDLNWRYVQVCTSTIDSTKPLLQISACTDIWKGYNSTFPQECISNEAPCCA